MTCAQPYAKANETMLRERAIMLPTTCKFGSCARGREGRSCAVLQITSLFETKLRGIATMLRR